MFIFSNIREVPLSYAAIPSSRSPAYTTPVHSRNVTSSVAKTFCISVSNKFVLRFLQAHGLATRVQKIAPFPYAEIPNFCCA